jgi:hypothetical protein
MQDIYISGPDLPVLGVISPPFSATYAENLKIIVKLPFTLDFPEADHSTDNIEC